MNENKEKTESAAITAPVAIAEETTDAQGQTTYHLLCPKCGHTWYSDHWDNYCPKWGCTGSPKRI